MHEIIKPQMRQIVHWLTTGKVVSRIDLGGEQNHPCGPPTGCVGGPTFGIQPKGNRPWSVAEEVRDQIRTERGQTEGVIGTLKSNRYKFNKPKERLWQTLEMAGPSSILSFNLNKFMRDLVELTK